MKRLLFGRKQTQLARTIGMDVFRKFACLKCRQTVDVFDLKLARGMGVDRMWVALRDQGNGIGSGTMLQTAVGYQADVISAVDSMDSMHECS